jgi:hypothetical protein
MAKLTENITIKRLRNKYRLVIMNDDTFEEIITFKLSRVSVYITLSAAFVLLVGLTTCLLVFTPLKYYIPGYGNKKSITQLQLLKYRTDSLEQAIKYNQTYIDGIKNAITGSKTILLDSVGVNIKVDNPHDDREVEKEPKKRKQRKRRRD